MGKGETFKGYLVGGGLLAMSVAGYIHQEVILGEPFVWSQVFGRHHEPIIVITASLGLACIGANRLINYVRDRRKTTSYESSLHPDMSPHNPY